MQYTHYTSTLCRETFIDTGISHTMRGIIHPCGETTTLCGLIKAMRGNVHIGSLFFDIPLISKCSILLFSNLCCYYVSPLTERWGHADLPLSASSVCLCLCVCVSHLFMFSAFYLAGGQARDVDPMLG